MPNFSAEIQSNNVLTKRILALISLLKTRKLGSNLWTKNKSWPLTSEYSEQEKRKCISSSRSVFRKSYWTQFWTSNPLPYSVRASKAEIRTFNHFRFRELWKLSFTGISFRRWRQSLHLYLSVRIEEPVYCKNGVGDAASALSKAEQGVGGHLNWRGVGRLVPGVSGLQLRDLWLPAILLGHALQPRPGRNMCRRYQTNPCSISLLDTEWIRSQTERLIAAWFLVRGAPLCLQPLGWWRGHLLWNFHVSIFPPALLIISSTHYLFRLKLLILEENLWAFASHVWISSPP